MKVKLGLQLKGVVLDKLKSTNLEYMDTTPFIQGVDERNKIYVYINKEVYRNLYQTVSSVSISYLLQNGRSTIKMSNNSMTEETIRNVVYKRYDFDLPTTVTAISGNIQATIYVRYGTGDGQPYDFKYNVINTVIASNTIEIIEDALSDTQSEILADLSAMRAAVQNTESNITNHNTRITALETNDASQDTKIGLLNTAVYGDSAGQQTSDGLLSRVGVLETDNTTNKNDIDDLQDDVETLQDDVETLLTDNDTNKSNIEDLQDDVEALQTDNTTNKADIVDLKAKDVDLQAQIDGLNAAQNLVDIVANLTALNSLSTTNLRSGDKVQVLVDSNHDNASTVYNWTGSAWSYIGNYGQDGYTKAEANALLNDKADKTTVNSHIANTSNPHNVTKAQVGLGNCDNTSDADKPISTATQAALDLKANASTTYTKTEVDNMLYGLTIDGYEIQWERLCDIFNEVYASDPLMTMLDSINGEVI